MVMRRVKDDVREVVLKLGRKEILAVGLFGSMARGDFDERSDIDIFVITETELPLSEQDELYYIFSSELIPKLGRDVTILVYDMNGLKRVPSWQTLNLIKDACFIYDRGGLKLLFKRILKEAAEHGIIYDEKEKVFRLEKVGRVVFSLGEKSKRSAP